jgi:hypothetical protein
VGVLSTSLQWFDRVAVPFLDDFIRLFSAFLLCDLSVLLFHIFRIFRSVDCGTTAPGISWLFVFSVQ